MKKYRYCKYCKTGTIQHSEKRYCDNKVGLIERCFLSLTSGGVYEACLDTCFVCSECGGEEYD